MVKSLLKDPNNLAILLIPFVTLIGAIYHISFWGTFNINGLALISVSEILTSSAYYIAIFIMLFTILNLVLLGAFGVARKVSRDSEFRNMNFLFGSIQLLSGLLLFFFTSNAYMNFLILGMGVLTGVPAIIARTTLYASVIPDYKRRYFILSLVIGLPLAVYCTGKATSYNIKRNQSFEYVSAKQLGFLVTKQFKNKELNSQVDNKLKLIGITSEFLVFTDFTNANTVYVKKSNLDKLVFRRGRIINGQFRERKLLK